MSSAGGGALNRRGARSDQGRGQRVHHHDVAHAGGCQQAAEVHGAAGDGEADGLGDLIGRPRAGGGEDLGRVRQLLRGQCVGQARIHRPSARRQGPGVPEPQDAGHTRAGPGQEGQRLLHTLRREIPAAADRAAHHGEQADRHQDERGDADQLAPSELTAAQVVLEGGDADADARRNGQRGRGEHDGLGRRERPEPAVRGGVGEAPGRQRHHPEARSPGQPGAAGDHQRQHGARHQQPGDGRAGRRPHGEADDVPPTRRGRSRDGKAEDGHRSLAGQCRADDPGQRQGQRHHHGLHRHDEHAPRRTACAHQDSAQHPGHRDHEDHGDDGRGEARRGGDDGAENDDLARGPAPPLRSGRDGVGLHAGRPGQPQRDEGEGGVGHQPVPATQAECPVRQREAEVADDRHGTGPRRHQRAEAARDAPGPERDAPQEQDPLQGPHGAEEDGPAEADQPEGGRGGRGGADPGRLPAREEVVPAGRPGRERGELPDERQSPEEEFAGPDCDDEERDDDGHGALTPGGQGRRPDPAAEAVPT